MHILKLYSMHVQLVLLHDDVTMRPSRISVGERYMLSAQSIIHRTWNSSDGLSTRISHSSCNSRLTLTAIHKKHESIEMRDEKLDVQTKQTTTFHFEPQRALVI
jgi:hypothetical protein